MAYSKDQYSDSGDFQADMDRLMEVLKEAKEIMAQPAFIGWMEATDQHFTTTTADTTVDLQTQVEQANQTVDNLMQQLLDAN